MSFLATVLSICPSFFFTVSFLNPQAMLRVCLIWRVPRALEEVARMREDV